MSKHIDQWSRDNVEHGLQTLLRNEQVNVEEARSHPQEIPDLLNFCRILPGTALALLHVALQTMTSGWHEMLHYHKYHAFPFEFDIT